MSLEEFDGRFGTRSGTRVACEALPADLPWIRVESPADRERGFDWDIDRDRVGVVERVEVVFERVRVLRVAVAVLTGWVEVLRGRVGCTPNGPHLLQEYGAALVGVSETCCTKSGPWSRNHLSISFSLKSGGAWTVNIIVRPVFLS